MTSTLALGLRALRPYLARTRRRRVSMCCRGGLGLCPRTSSCIGPRGSRAIAGQRLTLTAFCTENIPEEKKIFARRVGFFLFFCSVLYYCKDSRFTATRHCNCLFF